MKSNEFTKCESQSIAEQESQPYALFWALLGEQTPVAVSIPFSQIRRHRGHVPRNRIARVSWRQPSMRLQKPHHPVKEAR